jgi:multidrug/hemolysin transport system permease protein
MHEMKSIIDRNMKKYFRNKGTVIFSLLSAFIVSSLYIFFLTDMQIEYVESAVGNIDGIETMITSWIVGGFVCIPAVSVPLIMLCFKVDDIVEGKQDDLYVTSAKRIEIMLGYICSAFIVGFIMTIACFVLGEVFIISQGGFLLSFLDGLKIVGVLSLVIFTFTGLEFLIILFIKTNSMVTVANSILNVFLGFLLGLYVPIGMLGETVGNIVKAFPLLQASSIIRQIIMKKSLNLVLDGAPPEIISQIREMYGVDIVFHEVLLKPVYIITIFIICGIITYVGAALVIRYRKEK